MIYFDNAATSINKPKQVIDAVVYAMNNFGNASRGVNGASLNSMRTVFETRSLLNKFFNGYGESQVCFTSNATEALNIALFGCIEANDHVITTITEHNSVLRPLNVLKNNKNIQVDYVSADANGILNYEEFEKYIKHNTKLIVVNHCSNVTGNIVDIKKIGEIAKKYNAIFVVDASQTAGYLNIDVKNCGIDILCLTGHKSMLGPQGTGSIIVNDKVDIKPFKHGGSGIKTFNLTHPEEMPVKLEAGTLNVHGIAGLGAAVKYINNYGIEKIRKQEIELASYFYERAKKIKNIRFYGDYSNFENRAPIIALNIGSLDSAIVSDFLNTNYDISIRSGGHCAPKIHEHFKTKEQGIVRFSFGFNNTKDEIDIAIEALEKLTDQINL